VPARPSGNGKFREGKAFGSGEDKEMQRKRNTSPLQRSTG
jgi:hypothetical protein